MGLDRLGTLLTRSGESPVEEVGRVGGSRCLALRILLRRGKVGLPESEARCGCGAAVDYLLTLDDDETLVWWGRGLCPECQARGREERVRRVREYVEFRRRRARELGD